MKWPFCSIMNQTIRKPKAKSCNQSVHQLKIWLINNDPTNTPLITAALNKKKIETEKRKVRKSAAGGLQLHHFL